MEQLEASTPIRLQARFFGLKSLVTRTICHPLVGRALSATFRDRIPSRGGAMDTKSSAITPALKAALFWRIYESAEIRFVRKYLRGNVDVIELGSGLGVVSCQILGKLEPESRLVCVEANPNLLKVLNKNLTQHSNGRQFKVVHGAIANPAGDESFVPLMLADDLTASCIGSDNGHNGSIQVPALRLSNILRSHHLNRGFALVSDIEGAEVCFIEADEGVLCHCEQLIIELHETAWRGASVSVDRLRNVLEQRHGFKLRDHYGPVCLFEKNSQRRRPASNLARDN